MKLVFFYSKNNRILLVTDTIYIFTVAKQCFLDDFGTGTFFKRFYKKDVCQKLRYACCDVNIVHFFQRLFLFHQFSFMNSIS